MTVPLQGGEASNIAFATGKSSQERRNDANPPLCTAQQLGYCEAYLHRETDLGFYLGKNQRLPDLGKNLGKNQGFLLPSKNLG